MARVKESKHTAKKGLSGMSKMSKKMQSQEKKPHRYRPGTVALREIKKY